MVMLNVAYFILNFELHKNTNWKVFGGGVLNNNESKKGLLNKFLIFNRAKNLFLFPTSYIKFVSLFTQFYFTIAEHVSSFPE